MQGKQRQFTWRDGANEIEKVREDIYQFKTKKIVHLPSNKLSKTVDELCRKIINGTEPVLPPGFVPTSETDRADQQTPDRGRNTYERDPYLLRMKIRGGAFAILIAFHLSDSQVMSKQQICRAGQPYCDDEMEANYFGGRPRGAWSGINTLAKHGLVQENKAGVAYNAAAGGFRSRGHSSYTLTRNGERFIEALFKVRPEVRDQIGTARAARPSTTIPSHFDTPTAAGRYVDPHNSFPDTRRAVSKRSTSTLSAQDEDDLHAWVVAADIGDQKTFKVGKDRRRHLHGVCDEINSSLATTGKSLRHESAGASRSRELYITMERAYQGLAGSTGKTGGFHTLQSITPEAMGYPETAANYTTPTKHVAEIYGGRERLGGDDVEVSPQKRARTLPPSVAAGNAAYERLVTSQPASSNLKPPPKSATNLQSKPPARAQSRTQHEVIDVDIDPVSNRNPARVVIEIDQDPNITEIDDDDDGDLDDDNKDRKPAARPVGSGRKPAPNSQPSHARSLHTNNEVDLTEASDPSSALKRPPGSTARAACQFPSINLIIDNRERNRNATPRQLRMDLTNAVESIPFTTIWPEGWPTAVVEEQRLSHGDFAFEATCGGETRRLPIAVERKRVSDLVQRSARKDHWSQFTKMRDRFTVSFFLIEGDTRQAVHYTPFGAQHLNDTSVTNHTIDDEESFFLFVGRAILSSRSIRFIQSKDEQGTCRSIASLGLVCGSSYSSDNKQAAATDRNEEKISQQALKDRLLRGGIPWQLASYVSEEIGSEKQMDSLYGKADECCRSGLLAPLLKDVSRALKSDSSATGWSAAVHAVYSSSLTNPHHGQDAYKHYENLVEDKAALLYNLHSAGTTPEVALDRTLENREAYEDDTRTVLIEMASELREKNFFPDDAEARDRFYSVSYLDTPSVGPYPTIFMEARAGLFWSDRLCISLVEGEDLVKRAQAHMATEKTDFVAVARGCASEIVRYCSQATPTNLSRDTTRIILVRGLSPALERCAKRPGYRPETKIFAELVLMELMLRRKVVVLQAVRLTNDQELIIRQLALACYHFQLLVHATNKE